MKQILLKTVVSLILLFTSYSHSQTYEINSSGSGSCVRNGLDGTYICAADGRPAITLGTFTDTNPTSADLSSMSIVIYNACNGDFEVFLNETSIAQGSTTGTTCACEKIAENSNISNTITINLTPEIIAAYVIGGYNEISVSSSNSDSSGQCFYGADIMVTTSTLSANDFELSRVKIYPNPASEILTVSGLQSEAIFRMYNILGAEINRGTVMDKGEIDIQNLPNGLYLLQLGHNHPIKFIKQ